MLFAYLPIPWKRRNDNASRNPPDCGGRLGRRDGYVPCHCAIHRRDSPPIAPMDPRTALYRKVTWRLIPFLFACYILAYVDRVNVGFAKLQMQTDLRMSDTVYGIGAGLFFIGYFLLEVPANMMLRRLGARRWLGPIMIAW